MSTARAPTPVFAHDTGGLPTRPCPQFTADYKQQILEAAAQCTQAGQPRHCSDAKASTPRIAPPAARPLVAASSPPRPIDAGPSPRRPTRA